MDLDGALPDQPVFRDALEAGKAAYLPARDLASDLRIVGGRRGLGALRERLDIVRKDTTGGPPLIFYGSGDFHHLAALFLEQLDERVTVLHFDNHPDWTTFPATMNCGAWVCRALDLPCVDRVVTIGPSGDDFVRPQWKWANLDAIRQGRLEVHPWQAAPSRVFGRPVAGPGCRMVGNRLVWETLDRVRWDDFCVGLDRRLSSLPLWISFDKDVLPLDEAVTNWDQGGLRLEPALDLIARLGQHRRILGMDVCGDHSPPVFADPFRAFLSATDRPSLPVPDIAHAREINDRTNARILAAARRFLK